MSNKEKARLAGRAKEQLEQLLSSADSLHERSRDYHKGFPIGHAGEGESVGENPQTSGTVAEEEKSILRGSEILDEIRSFLGRFIAYPDGESAIVHVLWIAHTHMMQRWESTPRLAFLSPEPGSGKTRALELTELLVPNPVEAVNVSASALFRITRRHEGLPTILYDEIDTLFGPKAKGNEEIRALLNAGHRRGAHCLRSVPDGKGGFKVESIEAYCAVALAGLGDLPDTILDRSLVVEMRRRSPQEQVLAFRRRQHGPEGYYLRAELAGWIAGASDLNDSESFQWPEMPPGIDDRDADKWEPLFAIADAAGGSWPEEARVTAVTLVTRSQERSPSLGIRLLSDLHKIFGQRESLSSMEIVDRLQAMEGSPWDELDGKGLDPRRLASMLAPYGVKPVTLRIDGDLRKGYRASDFREPWVRYVREASAENSVTTVTSVARCGKK